MGDWNLPAVCPVNSLRNNLLMLYSHECPLQTHQGLISYLCFKGFGSICKPYFECGCQRGQVSHNIIEFQIYWLLWYINTNELGEVVGIVILRVVVSVDRKSLQKRNWEGLGGIVFVWCLNLNCASIRFYSTQHSMGW